MNDPRYQDLIAKSAHGVEGTDESAPPQAEPRVKIEQTANGLKCGDFYVTFLTGRSINFEDDSIAPTALCWWNAEEIDAVIALLQEARRQMGGG